ncbi:MAG: hypothetical protein HQ512_05330 [Rhodospirillales bacterium]|nr:hypothetical protein [Rhodospirillales bacterium]
MPYSLIVDILVAILLVITIGYAITLNKRLGLLRRDKDELERLARTFGESTSRAEESIEKLKNTADMLQERTEKAQALRDDLAFLIDRGGQAADHLEDLVRSTRNTAGTGPVKQPAPEPEPQTNKTSPLTANREEPAFEDFEDDKSEAERELLRAIRSAR